MDPVRPEVFDELFSDDEEIERQMEEEYDTARVVQGKCINVVAVDENGVDVICGQDCNPSEQLCHYCLVAGHRMTGLL